MLIDSPVAVDELRSRRRANPSACIAGAGGRHRDVSPLTQPSSTLAATFIANSGMTTIDRLYESGALRLRRPRGAACEAIVVNTGGGIVAGDTLALTFDLKPHAEVSVTTVAAEKIYRSAGAIASIGTRLALAGGARLLWLPQETILFDGARLARTFDVDLAPDARLVAAEMLVFGRLASGETTTTGSLRDAWRVRRDGRLVFADATLLEGAIGATLDRPALGGGARAIALLLVAGPDAEAAVEPLRAAFAGNAHVEAGVSARDGIVVARALARSPERLRASMVAALGSVDAAPPRAWG